MKIRPIIFVSIFAAVSAVYFLSPEAHSDFNITLYQTFPVIAALIALYTSRIYGLKSANGRALILITAGLVFWAIAETITYIYFLNGQDPFPSIADAFFLFAYPLFGAGIYQGYVTAGIKLKQVNKSLLTVVISASLILTILVGYFGVYQAYDPSVDTTANVVNVIYGLSDLVLVITSMFTILVAREYGDGKLASFWKTMAAGFLLFLIADILFAMYGELYWDGVKPYACIDLIWLAGFLTLAYGMLENYIHVSSIQKQIKLKLQQRKKG